MNLQEFQFYPEKKPSDSLVAIVGFLSGIPGIGDYILTEWKEDMVFDSRQMSSFCVRLFMKIIAATRNEEFGHAMLQMLFQLQGFLDVLAPHLMNKNFFEVFFGIVSEFEILFEENTFFRQVFQMEYTITLSHPISDTSFSSEKTENIKYLYLKFPGLNRESSSLLSLFNENVSLFKTRLYPKEMKIHLSLNKVGPVIGFIFDRFIIDPDTSETQMIREKVEYPMILSLGDYIDGSTGQYTLFAVFANYNPSDNADYGMSYSMVNIDGTRWYMFKGDEIGTEVNERDLLDIQEPYMLFYRKLAPPECSNY